MAKLTRVARRAFEEPVREYKIRESGLTKNSVFRQVVREYKDGRVTIDLRTWYCTKDDPEFKPGKGVTIPFDCLAELKGAVDKMYHLAAFKGFKPDR